MVVMMVEAVELHKAKPEGDISTAYSVPQEGWPAGPCSVLTGKAAEETVFYPPFVLSRGLPCCPHPYHGVWPGPQAL